MYACVPSHLWVLLISAQNFPLKYASATLLDRYAFYVTTRFLVGESLQSKNSNSLRIGHMFGCHLSIYEMPEGLHYSLYVVWHCVPDAMNKVYGWHLGKLC